MNDTERYQKAIAMMGAAELERELTFARENPDPDPRFARWIQLLEFEHGRRKGWA